ncbi:MAG: VanW family protein [Defluviitaleaceae bacterium]|nr:VanW family protein [Defluviitaleaceae bacterium]
MKKSKLLLILCFSIMFTNTTFANNLGRFSTKFNINNTPRVENLKLATNAINGKVIEPGAVFSYNETVGPTTEERGFKKSKIFVDGKEKEGFGGGVCQISSTLYNAALNAGMEIIERHKHSKDVAYVEENKDAATSYGVIDLKFKNTHKYPVVINAFIQENTVTVEILNPTHLSRV